MKILVSSQLSSEELEIKKLKKEIESSLEKERVEILANILDNKQKLIDILEEQIKELAKINLDIEKMSEDICDFDIAAIPIEISGSGNEVTLLAEDINKLIILAKLVVLIDRS